MRIYDVQERTVGVQGQRGQLTRYSDIGDHLKRFLLRQAAEDIITVHGPRTLGATRHFDSLKYAFIAERDVLFRPEIRVFFGFTDPELARLTRSHYTPSPGVVPQMPRVGF